MDAILLCMKKSGILFFRRTKFPTTNVVRFHTKHNFLGLLGTRYDHFDNVLIMAHGGKRGILTSSHYRDEKYAIYIDENDAEAFKNDFVFAVSCLTANQFGARCVEKGTIAYLGYQVLIGCLFTAHPNSSSKVPASLVTDINTLVKHIFIEELSVAYEEFLKTPISVKVLKERFAFGFEKRLSELIDMSVEQIHQQYNIKISDRLFHIFAVQMILDVMSKLNDILPKLVCLGDENYISSSYIKYRKAAGYSKEEIAEELESNPYFKEIKHSEYKQYLRDLVTC